MKELVEFLVKNLVAKPEAVVVTTTEDDQNNVVVSIGVDNEDIGKVIGRQGKIIMAIRTLTKAVGIKEGKKYSVEIIDGEKK